MWQSQKGILVSSIDDNALTSHKDWGSQVEQQISTANNTFSIGDLADKFGVSTETIRNWERQKLLPPASRTLGGHRRYTQEHVDAIQRQIDSRATASSAPSPTPALPVVQPTGAAENG